MYSLQLFHHLLQTQKKVKNNKKNSGLHDISQTIIYTDDTTSSSSDESDVLPPKCGT